ncbi:cupin domain-containing protein [Bradyrhizobium sp. 170]|uniref:cupin domain-containing protein n=1 Tax=Bradyrhizobium sp. 170 TaxID=2782641 RepID=UPI001FFF3EB8|nr:cupin domain-containing protein [Bradyrhizobium sp. 170]UPK00965.1 cupin domain-containing protein [Bradyrhizobium sp. 170]
MKMSARALAALIASASVPANAVAVEPPRETVISSLKQPIPSIAGKSLVASVVYYRPGAKSPPHRHPAAHLIFAQVLSGAIRSQVNDEPPKVYPAGASWFELPGAHHVISENASSSESAQLLVVFVVDADNRELIAPDPKQ